MNRRTGGRFITKSEAAAAWQVEAVQQLLRQRGRRKTWRGDVAVAVHSVQANKTPDIDNVCNAVLDALKVAQIIEDDKDVVSLHGLKSIDRERQFIEVSISEVA